MLLTDFRPITVKQRFRMRLIFWACFVVALALYLSTVKTFAYPGDSARWIMWADGLDTRDVVQFPLLSAFSYSIAHLNIGTLPLRLNILSAVAGAFCVGWVFLLVSTLIYEWMREESAILHSPRISVVGGLTAAFAAMFAGPVWIASVQFRPEIFEAFWLLFALYLHLKYIKDENILLMVALGVWYGIGAAESPRLVMAGPFVVALIVIADWKYHQMLTYRPIVMVALAGIFFVAMHLLTANLVLTACHEPISHGTALHQCALLVRDHLQFIKSCVSGHLWIPALCMGIGVPILTGCLTIWMIDNHRNWSLLALALIMTPVCLLGNFNISFTPTAIWMSQGRIPIFSSLLLSVSIGLLMASWRSQAMLDDVRKTTDPFSGVQVSGTPTPSTETGSTPTVISFVSHGFGLLMAIALYFSMFVYAAFFSWSVTHIQGDFADRMADMMLDRLNGRRWIVSNGILDSHLLIRAAERGIPIRLLQPFRLREPAYIKQVDDWLASDNLPPQVKERWRALLAGNFHLFLEDFFKTNPLLGKQVACMGVPDFWYSADWEPLPIEPFFGGVRHIKNDVDVNDLIAKHAEFVKVWAPFFAQPDMKSGILGARLRESLRHYCAFLSNDLGVALDDLNRPDDAWQCYAQALTLAPGHISALLNQFEMISRGMHPEMKDRVEKMLKQKVASSGDRYPLWSLSRFYGYVRNYELFVRMGWSWALSSSPASVIAGLRSAYARQSSGSRFETVQTMMASLYAMKGDYARSRSLYQEALNSNPRDVRAISGLVRIALQLDKVDDARALLMDGEKAGVPLVSLNLDWAALYLSSGDLGHARILLQRLADEPDASPMTLSMLAIVMMEQKELGAVENKILPRLIKMTRGRDSYFTEIVSGRIFQQKGGKGNLEQARICYLRASQLRPDIFALNEVILDIDSELGDQKAAEIHALLVLRNNQSHPFANYVLGSIRLASGDFGEAEMYLRRSCAMAEPSLSALNNFAEALCRIKKMDEAEQTALRATQQAPDRYETWATLAFILAKEKKNDEAQKAFERARSMSSADLRLYLIDAIIAINRKDKIAAQRALVRLGDFDDLSAADRAEAQEIQTMIGFM